MKHPLLVVLLIALFSFVLAQETAYIKNPPKFSDFPPVPNTCLTKQKLYVSTVAGNPAGSERGSALVSCQFHTVGCDAKITRYHSFPRPGGIDVCRDWVAARNALAAAALEVCCDPESPAEVPPPKKDEKCPPPTGWFDPTGKCTDKRAPWAQVRGNEVVLTVCGQEVFRHAAPTTTDKLLIEAYRQAMIGMFTEQVGSSICCDQFRDAVQSGVPCDPTKDLDCDGVPNQTDTRVSSGATFPDINIFNRAPGSRIDPFPPGLDPDDPDFLPNRTARDSKNVGDCPCKWELTKGELKCGQGGEGRHVYLATWKCPHTGAEVITTKYASAQTSCP